MYTRIALGKNTAMDVVSGESSGGYGQLLILYPLLFALQVYQFKIGVAMINSTYRAILSPEGYLVSRLSVFSMPKGIHNFTW